MISYTPAGYASHFALFMGILKGFIYVATFYAMFMWVLYLVASNTLVSEK